MRVTVTHRSVSPSIKTIVDVVRNLGGENDINYLPHQQPGFQTFEQCWINNTNSTDRKMVADVNASLIRHCEVFIFAANDAPEAPDMLADLGYASALGRHCIAYVDPGVGTLRPYQALALADQVCFGKTALQDGLRWFDHNKDNSIPKDVVTAKICDSNAITAQEGADTPFDPVNRPQHYNSHPSGVECADITEYYDFCVGNAIKYCWRAGLKILGTSNEIEAEIQDLEKAKWCLERKIKQLIKRKGRL